MTPEMLQAFYRMGVFVLGVSLLLFFLVEPDSAEYVISILSAGIGAALVLLVALASWLMNR
ncbi:MAG: hypothetical protein OXE95_03370 [Chloroflexi bacterium]|nr:hypothetical protein [Chloroflexota bacterium]MCY4246602.1 hypothetical protein [Chloroflexota bacterium]